MMTYYDELFKRWISGTLGEDEIGLLFDLMGKENDPWPDHIHQMLEDASFPTIGSAEQGEKIYQRLSEQRLAAQEPVKLLRRIGSRWWWAAAIFLLLIGCGYFWMFRKSVPTQAIVDNRDTTRKDFLPGINKATLTLSNGQRIILDSTANGQLAQQNGAIIYKDKDGKILYKKSDSLLQSSQPVVYNTLSTVNGEQYKLVLPDGTQVWINSASSITYPTVFTGKTRNVSITGEVYFEVTKNKEVPFQVQAKDLKVTVLGTHFNINAYSDEPNLATTLLEGAVRVSRNNEQLLLAPGQQARLNKNGTIGLIKEVNVEEVTAWKNGYFYFEHSDLPGVMRQIARWYNVSIVYKGAIPEMRFGGEIPRSVTFARMQKMLEESGVHLEVQGQTIIVYP